MTKQRPVPVSPAGTIAASKSTPEEEMSWVKTSPMASSATFPMNPAFPPRAATPATVLAAEPPDTSMLEPIEA